MSNIMLFGKTIQFDLNSDFDSVEHTTTTTTSSVHNLTSSSSSIVNLDHKISSPTTTTEAETEDSTTEDNSTAPNKTELLPPSLSSPFEDNLQPTTSSPNSQTESTNIKEPQNSTTTTSSDGGGGGGSQSPPLKKPDQILPCPRCKSTNTKFCYFNNYNINQPRHFCRCCQRYWTAGGTMRNIPVGSGRRNNNKTSDDSSSFNQQTQQPLQVFVPPCPMDERMTTMIYNNSTPNLQHNPQSPSLPAPPPYPQCYYWGSGVWTVAPPYWVNPSNSDQYPSSSSATTTGFSFTDETPTVGKRKRNEKQETSHHKEEISRNILIPKTLRMTDSNEAAKSSICATQGRITEENVKGDRIRSESARNKNSIRMVTGFRRTDEVDEEDALNGEVLQANPAALSMSIKFRETAQ